MGGSWALGPGSWERRGLVLRTRAPAAQHPTMAGRDRRRSERYPTASIPVQLSDVNGELIDLSLHGAAVVHRSPVKAGSSATLIFPSYGGIYIPCIVLRSIVQVRRTGIPDTAGLEDSQTQQQLRGLADFRHHVLINRPVIRGFECAELERHRFINRDLHHFKTSMRRRRGQIKPGRVTSIV